MITKTQLGDALLGLINDLPFDDDAYRARSVDNFNLHPGIDDHEVIERRTRRVIFLRIVDFVRRDHNVVAEALRGLAGVPSGSLFLFDDTTANDVRRLAIHVTDRFGHLVDVEIHDDGSDDAFLDLTVRQDVIDELVTDALVTEYVGLVLNERRHMLRQDIQQLERDEADLVGKLQVVRQRLKAYRKRQSEMAA